MYFLDIELYTTGVRVIRNPELAQPRVDIPESATTCTASIDGTTIRVREEQLNKASWAILSRSREPVTIELPGEIE